MDGVAARSAAAGARTTKMAHRSNGAVSADTHRAALEAKSRTELNKSEAVKAESTKAEATKAEAAKADVRRVEDAQAVKNEAAKSAAADETAKTEETAAKQELLARGARGPEVAQLQQQLKASGFNPGPVDGIFGPRTQRATKSFQSASGLARDGIVGPKTRGALGDPQKASGASSANASAAIGEKVPAGTRYAPGSKEAKELFSKAAELVGVPKEWANSKGLHKILAKESDGLVGRPNYTYGSRSKNPAKWDSVHAELQSGKKTARSSATGLGQLLSSNVDRHYPAGRAGIGVPIQEAAGMLSYIKERYGNPDRAWSLYGKYHEGY